MSKYKMTYTALPEPFDLIFCFIGYFSPLITLNIEESVFQAVLSATNIE